MNLRPLHRWEVSVREAPELQKKLAPMVRQQGGKRPPRVVAGADISLEKSSGTAFAGVVLLRFPSLEVLAQFTHRGTVRFPYVPGLLSFREAPLLLDLFRQVKPAPDLVFFDGQGLAHPRKFGLACHLGLFLDRPSIGCAKSRLIGTFEEPGVPAGSHTPLVEADGTRLGAVVRTRERCKPVFVSIGHKIDLETAIRRTLECTAGYRIPEPTRLAHLLVTRMRREAQPA